MRGFFKGNNKLSRLVALKILQYSSIDLWLTRYEILDRPCEMYMSNNFQHVIRALKFVKTKTGARGSNYEE